MATAQPPEQEPGQGAVAVTDERSPLAYQAISLLQEAIGGLKDQQQQILKLRFNEGKTQTEIADHIGVSQMHVSRLLRRALEDLRGELEEMENKH